jgi:hypothetical protein
MSEVEVDEWRQDIEWPDGSVSHNVLFIRATRGNVSYQAPIFTEVNKEDFTNLLIKRIEGETDV